MRVSEEEDEVQVWSEDEEGGPGPMDLDSSSSSSDAGGLAIHLGRIPATYDSSLLEWFLGQMPKIPPKPTQKFETTYRTQLQVLRKFEGKNGKRTGDLGMPVEKDIRKTLENSLIFFSDHPDNRREIQIFSEYVNMPVVIKESKFAKGYGLFTKENYPVNTGRKITEYGGLRLRPEEHFNKDSQYIVDVWDDDRLLFRIDGAHSFLLKEAGRWANRSIDDDDINAKLVYEDNRVWLIATRYIEGDEEILWDYGPKFYLSQVETAFSNFYI